MNPRLVSIVLLLTALVAVRLPGAPLPQGEPQRRLSGFPMALDGWSGKDDPFDDNVMRAVDTDDAIHRLYRKGDAYLWLYVGYYGTRKGGRTGHVPQYCYPAAGYRIVQTNMVPVKSADGTTAWVNHLVVERNGQQVSTLYWFHSGEQKILTDGWMMNFARLRRRLLNGRDDGALIRISGPVAGSVEETVRRQAEFARDFLTEIPAHWPLESKAPNMPRFAQVSGKHENS